MEKARTKYQDLLAQELELRIRRNPSYSLRAYARDLDLAPSGLSRILAGQQGLSLTKAKSIAKKLEFGSDEAQYFCSLVEAEHARSERQRELAIQRLSAPETSTTEISLEYFKTISDWYYYAIIELTGVTDFKNDPAWIAKRLGISADTVKGAIKTLLKLELIEETANGSLRKTEDFRATPSGVPNRAVKAHHQQILKKAEAALFEQEISEREHSAVTFTMNTEDLDWAREEMKKFRRALTKRLAKRPHRNRLYQFSMQLFAMDQTPKGKTP